ncbi:hypothetical protein [Algimonas arctica]|nr:hypothetical protein [Algimonas arctica]
MPFFPTEAATVVSGYGSPVIAFEFARTPVDLVAVFGGDADPARASRLSMMDQGNRWDFLFMTLYSLFGAMFGLAVRRCRATLGTVILVAAIIAGLADAIETRTLLSITAQMTNGIANPAGLATLWVPVTIKFMGLALSIISAGLFLGSRKNVTWKALGALTVLSALLSVPALLSPAGLGNLLTPSIGIGWIIMLAYALTRSVKGVTLTP